MCDPTIIISSKLKKFSHHVFWIWIETPPKVYFFVGNFFNISDASKSWLPFFSTIPRISKKRIDFSTLAVYILRVMKKHICMLNEDNPTWHGFGDVWCIGVQFVAIPCGIIMINKQSKSEIFCWIIIFLSFFNFSHELSLFFHYFKTEKKFFKCTFNLSKIINEGHWCFNNSKIYFGKEISGNIIS